MLNELFQTLNEAMAGAPGAALAAAFGWGICSVILSPCHLASIPLLIAYVNDREVTKPRQAVWLSTLFAVGILITMAVIGILTAMAGRMTGDTGPVGGYVMSAVFILIGLHLMDVVSVPWFGTRKEGVKTKGAVGAFALRMERGNPRRALDQADAQVPFRQNVSAGSARKPPGRRDDLRDGSHDGVHHDRGALGRDDLD